MLKKFEECHIQSYKHNGALHRTWCKTILMEANEQRIVVVSDQTDVVDSKPYHRWTTIEPAICFFYPDKWYNVIAMIRKKGIHFYCNVASPLLIEDNIIKYIDYDLDIKIDALDKMCVLDEDEFLQHSIQMHYSEELKKAILIGLEDIKRDCTMHNSPFDHEEILEIYAAYRAFINEVKKI